MTGNKPKLVVYGAHDTSIMIVLRAMGIMTLECISNSFFKVGDYESANCI